jgi:hypothetical protein
MKVATALRSLAVKCSIVFLSLSLLAVLGAQLVQANTSSSYLSGILVTGQTSHQRHSGTGDLVRGKSSRAQSYSGEMSAHIRAFNNDPNNSSGGWELKEEDWVYTWSSSPSNVTSNWVGAGGDYDGTYQCDLGVICYGTTLHYFYNGSDTSFFTSWSDDYGDGGASTDDCWDWQYPGCYHLKTAR